MDVAKQDEDSNTSLTDVFYVVNKTQHFEFPHADCDIHTNEELAELYFKQSGFGSYCCGVIASMTGAVCDLSALRYNSKFINYVTAWMRLKYVAEQVDPVRYRRYFERLPIPANKTPKLPAELLEIYKSDSTEVYAFVDSLANKIQMRWIEMLTGWDGNGRHPGLDIVCTWINTELQTFRPRTSTFDPYEFPIRPFLEYQYKLRHILAPCTKPLSSP